MDNLRHEQDMTGSGEYYPADIEGVVIQVRDINHPLHGYVLEDRNGNLYSHDTDEQPVQAPNVPTNISWKLEVVGGEGSHPNDLFGYGNNNVIPMPAQAQPAPGISPFQNELIDAKFKQLHERLEQIQNGKPQANQSEYVDGVVYETQDEYQNEWQPMSSTPERRTRRQHPNIKFLIGVIGVGAVLGVTGSHTHDVSKAVGEQCQLNVGCIIPAYFADQVKALNPNWKPGN